MTSRNKVSKLTQEMLYTDLYCVVDNTSSFPDSGHAIIGNEYIHYGNKTSKTLSDLTRGMRGSIRKLHPLDTIVVLTEDYNPVADVFDQILSNLGEDIYLDSTGDIMVNSQGDIRVATGLEALDVRLRVRISSDLYHGINNDVGVDLTSATQGDVEQLVGRVVDLVQSDSDVARVDSVKWNFANTPDHTSLYDVIVISMVVYVKGLSEGFQFFYKLNYNARF